MMTSGRLILIFGGFNENRKHTLLNIFVICFVSISKLAYEEANLKRLFELKAPIQLCLKKQKKSINIQPVTPMKSSINHY